MQNFWPSLGSKTRAEQVESGWSEYIANLDDFDGCQRFIAIVGLPGSGRDSLAEAICYRVSGDRRAANFVTCGAETTLKGMESSICAASTGPVILRIAKGLSSFQYQAAVQMGRVAPVLVVIVTPDRDPPPGFDLIVRLDPLNGRVQELRQMAASLLGSCHLSDDCWRLVESGKIRLTVEKYVSILQIARHVASIAGVREISAACLRALLKVNHREILDMIAIMDVFGAGLGERSCKKFARTAEVYAIHSALTLTAGSNVAASQILQLPVSTFLSKQRALRDEIRALEKSVFAIYKAAGMLVSGLPFDSGSRLCGDRREGFC